MIQPRPHLSDPEYAAFARRRYWLTMRWTFLTAVLAVGVALWWVGSDGSPLTLATVIATIAGVGLSVILAGALMGLIFLSSGTGHDEDVAAFEPEEKQKRRP